MPDSPATRKGPVNARAKKFLALIIFFSLCFVAYWWPTLGSTAKNFPGNRNVSSWISNATGGSDLHAFEGKAALANPLPPLPKAPHPVMNNAGYAGAHADSYNSGVIGAAGPLGRQPEVLSRMTGALFSGCSTQHFDRQGRLIAVCVGLTGSHLLLINPKNLEILADQPLPPLGGWYFRMDQKDRVVLPAGDMSLRIYSVGETAGQYHWVMQDRFDLLPAVPAEYHGNFKTRPMDVVADWEGNWWFSIMEPAAIGYVDAQGEIHSHTFVGEILENGLAADADGIYFVTDKHLYGMRASQGGQIDIFFKLAYDAGSSVKALSRGSGTTPVLLGDKLIAFGDNADPRPNLLVYRLDDVDDSQRLVCRFPVFKPQRSALENSFIGYDHSIVIENNMGFSVFGNSSGGKPGILRVDVRPDLSGCDLVWENYSVRAGTGAKLSTATGLIYVHELLMNTGWINAWYISAIDFRTGELAWRQFLGTGKQWDNAMLTMSIGPDGLLTSGMFAGLAALRDGPDP